MLGGGSRCPRGLRVWRCHCERNVGARLGTGGAGAVPHRGRGTQTAALGEGEAGGAQSPHRGARTGPPSAPAPLGLRRPCQRLNGAKRPPPSHWPLLPPVKPPAASPLAVRPGRGRGGAGAAL